MDFLPLLALLAGVAGLSSPFLRPESSRVRDTIIFFGIAALLHYLVWRVTSLHLVEPGVPFAASAAFLLLELASGYLWVQNSLSLRRTVQRTPEVERQLDWYETHVPRVDLFIATYNEPWEVLEKTLVGAKSQDYTNYHIWILDDGQRDWLKQAVEAQGVGYFSRSTNLHYKAGNLNNGLECLRAQGAELEFVAVLDADFVARPQFLRRTLALMKTPNIGIVQTPQCFYNPDPHQQTFGGIRNWPDEQRAWFDTYLPALDAAGWASCCGTSCLIRVAALDAIGGFPTESVCEDTLSSIKMLRKNYRTVFLSEPLTIGLAPEGIGEFLTQRARWLLGGVQNTRFASHAPGLWSRIDYWLRLWRNAIWGSLPIGWMLVGCYYMFTGVGLLPIRDLNDATRLFGPLYLDRLFSGWLFGGRQLLFVSDAVWALLSPLWIKQTFLAVLGLRSRFKVTDKAIHRDRRVFHWHLVPFYFVLAGLPLAGLIYNLVDSRAPLYQQGFFQLNTLITLSFVLMVIAGISPFYEPPKRRRAERYASDEPVIAEWAGGRRVWKCRDISIGGVLVDVGGDAVPEGAVLQVQNVGGVAALRVREAGSGQAAFQFTDPTRRPLLIQKLLFDGRYTQPPTSWSLTRSLLAFVKRVFF